MNKLILIMLSMCVLVTAPAAYGAMVTVTGQYPPGGPIYTDWPPYASISVPKFDTSLGTLTGVSVYMTGELKYEIGLENTDRDSSQSPTLNWNAWVKLEQPGGGAWPMLSVADSASLTKTLPPYDGTTDYSGDSGITEWAGPVVKSDLFTSSDASYLTLFVGTGAVTFPATTGGSSSVTGSGNVAEYVLTYPLVSVQVTYEYEPVTNPGTGTPGYWKNHPEAWPVDEITIGGTTYTKAAAIKFIKMGDGDKTLTLFRALVCAKLNVMIGNESSCIQDTILAADAWMATYGPVGSKVKANSEAWKIGEPLCLMLDAYNNGKLCAPSRG